MKKLSKLMLILFAAIAAVVALTAMIARAVQPSEFDTPNNFSRTAKAGYASGPAFIKSDGSTLAIVWSDGANQNYTGTKYYGNIYLKSGDEIDDYWREKIKVFTATNNDWGVDPAYVFDATAIDTIHVVWAQATGCNGDLLNCDFISIQYAQCDVSDDYNTCDTPQEIFGGNTVQKFRRPAIAQDDLGNLHVVWTDENSNAIFYSRGVDPTQPGGPTWSSATLVTDAPGGKSPQLAFSNGRLHMVWDAESAGTINYLYDDNLTNDVLAKSGTSVWSFSPGGDYTGANPGSPSIAVVDPTSNILYIAFDMADPNNPNNFALGYSRSTNNGTSWTGIRDIPTAKDNGTFTTFQTDKSRIGSDFGGLQPTLAITYTGSMTYINVVWQSDVFEGEGNIYEVFHSARVITSTTVGFDKPWSTPFTLTNPTGGVPRVASNNGDSVMPTFTISDPNNGGADKMHLAYLEMPPNANTLDAYYRGVIAGTIDPAYLLDADTFAVTHAVTPTQIITSNRNLPPQIIRYTLRITNSGNLNAVGVGITDTFNLPSLIGSISKPTGGAKLITATKTITWNGDLAANSGITIEFTATTTALNLPVTILNTAQLWNIASEGKTGNDKIIISKAVATRYQLHTIYLPLVFK